MKGGAFYNENDAKAAAWLRELIAAGLIAPGVVDERSIVEIEAQELYECTQCHFFAGIGGWSLALRLAGWADERPVWTGSCPCQPFSNAGKRRGRRDARHLWPAFRDLIADAGPATVFGEQVASKAGRGWLAGVRADLEALGYAVGAADLCAAGAGAPHIRQRLWWVAESGSQFEGRGLRGPGEGAGAHAGRASDQSGGSGGAGDVDDAECATGGPRAVSRDNAVSEASGRIESAARAGECGATGDVDDATNARRTGIGQRGAIATPREEARVLESSGSGAFGSWSAFDLVACLDGKARRVEPGSFPLADGVPGRVGLLRGYGNAIVPEVAAQFILAYGEARGLMA